MTEAGATYYYTTATMTASGESASCAPVSVTPAP
jgi:hypothetical protein